MDNDNTTSPHYRRLTIKTPTTNFTYVYKYRLGYRVAPEYDGATDSEALHKMLCTVDPGPEYVAVFTEETPFGPNLRDHLDQITETPS